MDDLHRRGPKLHRAEAMSTSREAGLRVYDSMGYRATGSDPVLLGG